VSGVEMGLFSKRGIELGKGKRVCLGLYIGCWVQENNL